MNFSDILDTAPFSNSDAGPDFFMEVSNEKGEGLEPMLSDDKDFQQAYFPLHPYYYQNQVATNGAGPIADMCTFSMYENGSDPQWFQSGVPGLNPQPVSMVERVVSSSSNASNAKQSEQTRKKRRNSTDLKDTKVKQCYNCKTTSTPQWRKGANKISLCNRCGLYFIRHLCLNPNVGNDNNTGKTETTTASNASTTRLSEAPAKHYSSITVQYSDANGEQVLGRLTEKDVVDFVVSYLDASKKNANKL